jgi:hypothetical protein
MCSSSQPSFLRRWMSLTVTGGVGYPQGAARVRAGATCPGARGGEDRRPMSTAAWRRRAPRGRRSEGGPGVHEASLAPDAQPTRVSFAKETLHRPSASDRSSCAGIATGAAGVAILEIYRLALLCFPSSNAFIPTDTGVGRPSSGRSPSVLVTAMVVAARAVGTAREGGVLGGDEAPLPSYYETQGAVGQLVVAADWLDEGRETGTT